MSRKKGLGRGLDALLAPPEETVSVREVAVDRLRPNRRQPRRRFDDDALGELAESIRVQGIVQPIVVSPEGDGTYRIVAGERRWRAARRVGLSEVPVTVRTVDSERELLELALVENLQRSDLNPLEEAEAYRALQDDFGLKQEEVAARVGKARPTVANALRLLRLAPEVQGLLRDGSITAGQARPLLAIGSPSRQAELGERAAREGLTARKIEELARQPARARRKSPRPKEAHAAAAEEKLTRRLQTKVEIRRRGKGGQVCIHFHSEAELIRLYDHLMKAGETP